ncbi:MAG: CocE/NonD family hydrolase [Candidatus Kapaibacterium sp.]
MKKLIIIIIIAFAQIASAFDKENVMLPMPDGTKLYTDIYKPSLQHDFPLPVILIRSPYGAESFGGNAAFNLVVAAITEIQRYVLVMQDLRGTNNSEGENTIFREDGWGEKRDGYETIEWIAAQDWCDGRVVMFGPSALGIPQYLAAGAGPEHFVGAMPMVAAWSMYHHCVYPGGEYRESDVNAWVDDYANNDMLPFVKDNYNYNQFWEEVDCNTRVGEMHQPMLHFGGWFDFFHPGQIEAFEALQNRGGNGARGRQRLIVGPWTHLNVGSNIAGDMIFPLNANYDYLKLAIDWFNYLLRDSVNSIADLPYVKLYLMGPTGEGGHWNKWLEFDELPFADTDTLNFYLGQNNNLLDEMPYNTITHLHGNPDNPVPTIGGNNLFLESGPKDQSAITDRNDVLLYQSDTYAEPFDIFGRVRLILTMSANRPDVDIAARLVDVYPNGRKMLITDGIKMARHRNGFATEDLLTPHMPYEIEVDLNYTAYTIAPGHRLGIILSTSNYPKYKVNPNTGDPVHDAITSLPVDVTIFTQGDRVSRLELPIRKTGFTSVAGKNKDIGIRKLICENDNIYINAFSESVSVAKIYDMSGREIASLSLPASASPVPVGFDYPRGMYIMVLSSGTDSKIYQIMKI